MDQPVPPSSRSREASNLFLIGKNTSGQWVAQDARHLRGGLFVSCAEAIKFALFENGHRTEDIILVLDSMELDMAAKPAPGPALLLRASQRRAA
jgi:hypothetical protein